MERVKHRLCFAYSSRGGRWPGGLFVGARFLMLARWKRVP